MQGLLEQVEAFTATFDIRHYLRYFSNRLHAKPKAHLTGDITPEYCMLSAENLREIRDMLKAEGYSVKALFIMRDPVERCYSSLRMGYRRALKAGKDNPSLPHENFERYAVADWCQTRTRYEKNRAAN